MGQQDRRSVLDFLVNMNPENWFPGSIFKNATNEPNLPCPLDLDRTKIAVYSF